MPNFATSSNIYVNFLFLLFMQFRCFFRLLIFGTFVTISLYFALLRSQKQSQNFEDKERNFFLELKITAGPDRVFIAINDSIIIQSDRKRDRGIHIAILHELRGYVMAYRKFDTFEVLICDELLEFLASVSKSRILILATKDEASYNLANSCRLEFVKLGSQVAQILQWRDSWVFVGRTGMNASIIERHEFAPNPNSWGKEINLLVRLTLKFFEETPETHCQNFNIQQQIFCEMYEGYADICNCDFALG